MKVRIGIILLFSLILFPCLFAQNTELIGDNIELTIDGYKGGQIQWQISTDSINWKDIENAKTKSISVIINENSYYRAKVINGKCIYFSSIIPIKAYYYKIRNLSFKTLTNDTIKFTWKDPTAPDFNGISIKNLNDSSIINVEKGKQSASVVFKSPYDSVLYSFRPIFSSLISIKDTIVKIDNYNLFFSQSNRFVAHKGYSSLYPENTILAFRKAAEVGFTFVECDLRFTNDNIGVLCHDDSISKVSNGTGKIYNLKYNDLLKFNFGYPSKFNNLYNEPIAAYEDFLKLCKTLNLFPQIEIKFDITDRQATDLIKLTLSYLPYYQFCFHSFNFKSLEILRKINKKIILGYTSNTYSIADLIKTKALFPSFYSLNFVNLIVNGVIDYVFLNSLNTNNKLNPINIEIWSLDDKQMANDFLKNGIKNVITNYPLFK